MAHADDVMALCAGRLGGSRASDFSALSRSP